MVAAEVLSVPWGLALTAGAVLLLVAAVRAAVKAKHAEGDIGGVLANASVAAFLLTWAFPLAWFGLYLLGVAAPDAMIPGFVVLGCLGAALLITSMVLTVRKKKGT